MRNTIERRPRSRLGDLELRVLGYTQARRIGVARIGELRGPLRLSAAQEREVLSRLARAGTIVRLKREVYLLPPRIPIGGVWTVSPHTILSELMRASRGGRFQLCGWETFRAHGLTDQVSNRLYVYDNRISGDRIIGGHAFTFIKVADSRLGGVDESKTPDGVPVRMPSLSRALFDAVYDYARFDTLPAAYAWIRAAAKKDPRIVNSLAAMASELGDQGTIRRLGFVLSGLGLATSHQRRLLRALRSSKSLVPLIPRAPARGRIDRVWGVIVNE
jgi:predicted transcriptional regulator of viral defense system